MSSCRDSWFRLHELNHLHAIKLTVEAYSLILFFFRETLNESMNPGEK